MGKPYSQELIDIILQKYSSGETGIAIALKLNLNVRQVYVILRRNNAVRQTRKITGAIASELVELAFVKKEDIDNISKKFGIDKETIYKHFETHGLKLGKHGIRRNRCIKCNEELKPGDIYERFIKVGNWTCKKCEAERTLTKARKLKREVVDAYGGKCMCCGDTHWQFLTVDHINNDGATQRKTIHSGNSFYYYLKRNGFPRDEYALLCMNCNWCKGVFGHCAHIMDAVGHS